MIRIELPIPPSVNECYSRARGGRVFATAKLRQWKVDAGWEIARRHWPRETIKGPYSLQILVPEDMPGDVDNRVKPLSDILVTHGITPDDRKARGMSVDRSPDVPFGRCFVVVESAS